MSHRFLSWCVVLLWVGLSGVHAVATEDDGATDDDKPKPLMSKGTFAGLKFRSIGPALMSGRVGDFAVDPNNPRRYYVAVCSGGVWKTINAGATWKPVFDKESSYSIGCVEMDPANSSVVWVGSGENNSQRSVSFGDGVYKTIDDGKSWKNMGLKESEHIGMIKIDPRDSNTVYVAAQGPLWKSGGDRGLYKTTDGGETWERILHISDDTGVNEIHFDPRDPDVLYASSYQRRRRVWTLINGGPESAIHKSTDAGKTWRKLTEGIPKEDKGRIGMCISPVNPDVVYAIVESQGKKGGFFRSENGGETWDRRNEYMASSPQYYNEIVCDPANVDRVYSLDTFLRVTEDGGKTFKRMPRTNRHVDDHALWINPTDTDHMLIGCDGGIYETADRGTNWHYKPNFPVTQFYRVSVDNSLPFYFVYGGTQDNNTMGGPSRTRDRAGITNNDWFVTVGGDGYETQVDPLDPNVVYSQWQYGGLVRHDRRNGEIVDIKPREAPGEKPYRWNWDSPVIISPHSHTRLYFAANRLFRSDDRGNSWVAISPDLTRQQDRNELKVLGKLQSVDAVSKNKSTSFYGNIVSLAESSLVEGLIYVGTDDGLVQVTEDGGATWRKIDTFPPVPDITYVSCLTTSLHHPDTVYASFDNHKNGDFNPYLMVSTDRGRTWQAATGDLPEREIIYSIQQDHVDPQLLFVGTEFGVYFSSNSGTNWIQLSGGLPTIAVRDMDIQRRENDLVLGTFGRGFYILDDYSPLRGMNKPTLEKEQILFPVKDALQYVEVARLGGNNGKGSQGASYFATPNPPYGAVFTYYLKDKIKTRKETRQEQEKETAKNKEEVRYPSFDELRAEDEEKEPAVMLLVSDDSSNTIRRLSGPRKKGFHKVAWDLRWPASEPINVKPKKDRPPWERDPVGPMALPGTYTVMLAIQRDGAIQTVSDPQVFKVVPLELATFPAKDREEVLAFNQKVARLQRAVLGALKTTKELEDRFAHLRKAFAKTPSADRVWLGELNNLQKRLNSILTTLRGDRTVSKRSEPTSPSVRQRVQSIASSSWYSTSEPTLTHRDGYRHAGAAFTRVLDDLRTLTDDLTKLEAKFEAADAPWTPGRLPSWTQE